MSATTERLLEEIKHTEETLASAEARGDTVGVDGCKLALEVMRKHLAKANEALNEGRQILKG